MMPFTPLPKVSTNLQNEIEDATQSPFGINPNQFMNPSAKIIDNQPQYNTTAAGPVWTPDQYMQAQQKPAPMSYEQMMIMQLMGAAQGRGI